MREDLIVSHLEQCEFTEVRVGREVFQGMKELTEETVSFVKILFLTTRAVLTTEMDTALEGAANEGFGGVPMAVFFIIMYPR